ncbi:hypothetical protein E1B28_010824 [Marasmius oreades]|uniref:DUF6533 domain-containing protein n=1 Tax=Marasmius oreades TaxID=181124 RepID=A0A9P7RSY4_9AGAR|nr:uncharacterized protein E1B28_010824 [Marasmius oreades]KAG7089115.1 hypothetical protein E1B28_010824 [Marasmius oreades]
MDVATGTAAKAGFEIVTAMLDNERLVAYIDVLSATLLVYDVIINLPVEIEHIRIRKWSLFTVVYILQRYLPFFDSVGLVLHHHFGANLSTRYCNLNYEIAGWSFAIGVTLSQIILILRVWAVWHRSLPVAIGLAFFFLACWVPSYVFTEKFVTAVRFATLPFPDIRGCFIAGGSNVFLFFWVLMMVYDTGTLVMMLISGVVAYRMGGRSQLIETIYRDGVIYYVLIFLISMLNVVVVLILPSDLLLLLTSYVKKKSAHPLHIAHPHSTTMTGSSVYYILS